MSWTRPESVDYPQIWWKFTAKDPETGDLTKYVVEDLPEERFGEAVDLMFKYFLPDEVMNQSLGFVNDQVSMKEGQIYWLEVMPQKLSLICRKEDSQEICGLNMLEISEKTESSPPYLQLKGKCLKTVLKLSEYLKDRANIYERYNVDRQLNGVGLLTLPKYRGCGIATELLKGRIPMMKALGLKLTATVFSGPGSQAAAEKAGFTEDFVTSYEALGKEYPFIEFPNISWPITKCMSYYLT